MREIISVIVPCYNEEQVLTIFYDEICKTMGIMSDLDFELLFIDDGSRDGTLGVLKELNARDKRCKFYSFSRNFGKEAAIYAGLKHAKGDYAVLMDADLQDPPSLLPEMYHAIKHEGYDSVGTRRSNRKGEPVIRSLCAKLFYKLIRKISKIEIVDGERDYRLITRQMVDAILEMSEYNRFTKGIFGWIGFRTKWIAYNNVERAAGETKWSFFKLLKYSMEGIMGFSVAPLAVASIVGLLFCAISFLMIIFIILRTFLWGDPVAGWPSLVCIIFFVGGIQLFCTGIVGEYLSKTYLETKHRPIYILHESSETKAEENHGEKGL